MRYKKLVIAFGILVIVAAAAGFAPATAHATAPVIATGTVRDAETSAPVMGAYLTVDWWEPENRLWRPAGEAYAAADGSYVLRDKWFRGPGDYQITCTASGYVSQTSAVMAWDGATPLPVNFDLRPTSLIATGTVRNAVTGVPVTAYLWAEWRSPSTGRWIFVDSVYSAADGSWSLRDKEQPFGAGDYRIHCQAGGYVSEISGVMAWDGVTPLAVDFNLKRAVPIFATGAAWDSSTGAPVRGAYVEASRWDPVAAAWMWADETYTAADGSYTLFDWWFTGAGSYRFYCQAEGYVSQHSATMAWDGMTALPVSFSMKRLTYTLVYSAGEGGRISGETTQTVSHGSSGTTVTAVPDAGFRFIQWSDGVMTATRTHKNVLSNMSVTAQFAPLPFAVPVEGPTRFDTAVAVSKATWPGGLDPAGERTVVIATGRNFPDALGGTALASLLDGPILLVELTSIPPVVMSEIRRLGAEKAVILGGTGAVGESVESALEAEFGEDGGVSRISGPDRYATANAIAAEVKRLLGGAYEGRALVATGEDFPDALAAAPLAAAQRWPLYLAHPRKGLSAETRASLTGVNNVVILGGKSVVSTDTETYLKGRLGLGNVLRLGGADRFKTAVAISEWAVANHGHTWQHMGITTGFDFPDALDGGVMQGKKKSVMLLTPPESLNPDTKAALETNRKAVSSVTFFGGTGAVSDSVRTQVMQAVK